MSTDIAVHDVVSVHMRRKYVRSTACPPGFHTIKLVVKTLRHGRAEFTLFGEEVEVPFTNMSAPVAPEKDILRRLASAFEEQVGWSECDSCRRQCAITYPGGGEGTPVPEGSFCARCAGGDEDMLVYRDEVL